MTKLTGNRRPISGDRKESLDEFDSDHSERRCDKKESNYMKKLLNNDSIYTYDEWNIVEEDFKVENNARNETVFALGNGYIGMRGNFEEGYSGPVGTSSEGTFLNGFYESETIKYGEIAYGYAEKGQTMLNVVNSKVVKLFIEDEKSNLFRTP